MEGGTDGKEEVEEKKKKEDRGKNDVFCNRDQTEMEKYVGKNNYYSVVYVVASRS